MWKVLLEKVIPIHDNVARIILFCFDTECLLIDFNCVFMDVSREENPFAGLNVPSIQVCN